MVRGEGTFEEEGSKLCEVSTSVWRSSKDGKKVGDEKEIIYNVVTSRCVRKVK